MGTAAVSGHRRETAGAAQNQEQEELSSKHQTSDIQSDRDNQMSSQSTFNLFAKQSVPTDPQKNKPATQIKMACDRCSVNFSLFKRKKCCQECHRFFCSNCLPKPQSSSSVGRQCSKCRLLMSGRFSRDDLQAWKINDIRCFLNVRNISTKDCREKHDLIELVFNQFCRHPQPSVQNQAEHETLVRQMMVHMRDVSFRSESSSNETSNESSPISQRNAQAGPLPEMYSQASASAVRESSVADPVLLVNGKSQADNSASGSTGASSDNKTTSQAQEQPNENPFERHERFREFLESVERIQAIINQYEEREPAEPTEQPIRRTQLDDITEMSAIDDLSVRQLKELLVNNFVDYKGCCEKAELIEKTKLLWKDYQENKIRAQRIHKQEEAVCNSQETNFGLEKIVTSKEVTEESATLSAATVAALPSEAAEEDDKHPDLAVTDISGEATATNTETLNPMPDVGTSLPSRELKSQRDDSLCHICMDSLVDCILLECGHMVTCTQCGKRLSNCPICRQYIVRVVRVFRS